MNGSSIISSKPIVDVTAETIEFFIDNMEVGTEYHYKYKNIYYAVRKLPNNNIKTWEI